MQAAYLTQQAGLTGITSITQLVGKAVYAYPIYIPQLEAAEVGGWGPGARRTACDGYSRAPAQHVKVVSLLYCRTLCRALS